MSKSKQNTSYIKENYFNDKDASSDELVTDIEASVKEASSPVHTIYIAVRKFLDDDFKNAYINVNQLNILIARIKAICNQSSFFDDFEIYRYYAQTKEYVSIKETPYFSSVYSFFIAIKFVRDLQASFNTFAMTAQKLCSIIYSTVTNNFKYTIDMNDDTFIKADDVDYKVSFSFLTIQNLKKLYSIITDEDEETISLKKKTTDINFHFNGSRTIDNTLSVHKLQDVKAGDILYSTENGHLVLDPKTNDSYNIPIAIATEDYSTMYQNDGNYTVRFMSLNYMSWFSPSTGSKRPCAFVFGDMNNKVNTDSKNPLYGQTLNYFYDYMNSNPIERVKNSYIIVNSEKDNFPVFESVFFYHTKGTSQGDWYIPVYYEFRYCIQDNKEAINNARQSLGLEPLADLNYFTCVESNEYCCNTVDMENCIMDAWWDKDKSEDTCAIALINVIDE